MSTPADTLLDILDNQISRAQAERLIADAGGDLDTALAVHFSQPLATPSGPASTQDLSPEAQKIAALRSVLGNGVPEARLKDLLRRAAGSVDAAVGLYLDNPHSNSSAGGAGPSGSGAAHGRQATVNLADSEGEGAADRSQKRRKSRPRATTAAGTGSMAAAPAAGRSGAAAADGGLGPAAAPASRANGAAAGGTAAGAPGRGSTVAGGSGAGAAAPAAGASGAAVTAPQARAVPGLGAASGGLAANGSGASAAAGASGAPGTEVSAQRSAALPPRAPRPADARSAADQGAGGAGSTRASAGPNPPGSSMALAGAAAAPVPTSGAAASAQGQPPSAALPPRPPAAQAQRDRQAARAALPPLRPLMDGDMLVNAKRTQGPFPRSPYLPLAERRRADGSLFLSVESAVPGRTRPPKELKSFSWPMRLGKLKVPLELDFMSTRFGTALYMPPEVRRGVLQMALDWFQKGQLRLDRNASGPSDYTSYTGLYWKAECLFQGFRPAGTPDHHPVISREAYRLSLRLRSREFLKAAAAKFPNTEALDHLLAQTSGCYLPELCLAVTAVGGPMERLARFWAQQRVTEYGPVDLNNVQKTGVRINVHVLGPGLDPELGLALKTDVSDKEVAKQQQDGSHTDSGSDSDDDGAGAAASGKGGKKDAKKKRKRDAKAEANGGKGSPAVGSQKPRKKARTAVGAAEGGGTSGASGSPTDAAAGSPLSPRRRKKQLRQNQSVTEERFRVSLEFFISQEALEESAPPSMPIKYEGPRGGKKGGDTGEKLANVIHSLLEHGSGLYVGPDCDGAINTGDAELGPEARQGQAGAHAGGTSAAAGPSTSAGAGRRSRAPSAGPANSGGPGAASSGGGASSGNGSDVEDADSEGARNLDELLDSIQPPADLPQAVAPPTVAAHPKPFQLQGLEWMLRRERRGDAVGRSLLLLHPGWAQVVVGSSRLVLHVHRLAPYYISADFFPAPVGGTCGGFLCDEMGLGKSLQTLMLIASNPPPEGWAAEPEPVVLNLPTVPSGPGRKAGAAGAGASGSGAGAAAGGPSGQLRTTVLLDTPDREPVPIRTTLLVTPANLQEQWAEEIKRHMHPGALKWATYRGWDRSISGPAPSMSLTTSAAASAALSALDNDEDAEGKESRRRPRRMLQSLQCSLQPDSLTKSATKYLPVTLATDETGALVPIHECDLVLCSYEVLRKELSVVTGGGAHVSRMLPRLGFWRIVLDEAQLVANNNSLAAGVVSSLYRRHAWVVTGTPISSNIDEVQGLCEFLSYEPFYHSSIWRNLLHNTYVSRSPAGVAAFRALLRGVMLRRSKAAVEDQLALPPCARQDLVVTLSGVERVYYDVIKGRFNAALAALRSAAASGGAAEAEPRGRGRTTSRESAQHRAQSALVDLRQCCCHPHIVRREAEGAAVQRGPKAAQAKAAQGTAGADGRRSMRQIMSNLVAEAYSGYDQATAGLFSARLLQAALAEYKTQDNDGPGTSAGAGTSNGSGSAAAGGVAGPLLRLLDTIRAVTKVVGEPDMLRQGHARRADGALDEEKAAATMAFGAEPGGMGGLAPLVAAEQAKDRRRRWQRLQLEALTLRCYLAFLQSPPGTLQLLAIQAKARALADARTHAEVKLNQAVEALEYRTAALATAQADAEEAQRALERAQMAASPGAASAKAAAKARRGKAGGKGGGVAAGKDAKEDESQEEADVRRAVNRLTASNRALAEATEAEKTARAGLALAGEMATVAATEAAEATAAEAVAVADAAARIHAQNEEVNELRVVLGMDPVDFGLAETELRRSRRQQQEAGGQAGGSEAGPSGFASAAGVAAATAAAAEAAKQRDASSDDDNDDDDGDCSDSSSDGRRRKKKRGGKELVGGGKRRSDARGGKHKLSGDDEAGGGTAGMLITLGGTPYQEALFRAEPVVRNFQQQTARKGTRAVDAADALAKEEARLLHQTREKWHNLQHLMNQQKELNLADDLLPTSTGGAADETAAGGDAAGGAGGSAAAGSGAGGSAAGGSGVAAAPDGLGQGGGAGAGLATREEELSCPICLDPPERRTVTKCGHSFCTDCIHDIVQGKGTAPCPICRRPLTRADLFDSMSEEEAAAEDAMAALTAMDTGNAEYGAKVTALLEELGRMTAEDPGSKALVFSSWGRLLRLVQEALVANGVRCVSLLGANPEARQKALHDFLHDPGCRVLLLIKSTSGGAAGLTLTMAHTAFMMEPAVNPGLEAQAAARICRLGQDRPTRVVRIIAKDTVEERVLALQQHKQLHGDTAAAPDAGTEGVDRSLMLRFFDGI